MENIKWVRFRLDGDLHSLFKRVAKLDPDARGFLSSFAQLAMKERAERILNENEHKRLYGRVQTTPTEDNGDDV